MTDRTVGPAMGPPRVVLVVEPYDSAASVGLVARVQAEYVQRYGSPDDAPVDPTQFAAPDGVFVVGYLDGVPVVTGGLRRHADGEVEIKRMYVVPEARGRGLSRVMLAELEATALRMGARRVVLETGRRQPEAMRLYESTGYQQVRGYGHYADSPLSVSYDKQLVVRRTEVSAEPADGCQREGAAG